MPRAPRYPLVPIPATRQPPRFSYTGQFSTIPGSGGEPIDGDGDLYVATRTDTGWVSHYVGLPSDQAAVDGGPPQSPPDSTPAQQWRAPSSLPGANGEQNSVLTDPSIGHVPGLEPGRSEHRELVRQRLSKSHHNRLRGPLRLERRRRSPRPLADQSRLRPRRQLQRLPGGGSCQLSKRTGSTCRTRRRACPRLPVLRRRRRFLRRRRHRLRRSQPLRLCQRVERVRARRPAHRAGLGL